MSKRKHHHIGKELMPALRWLESLAYIKKVVTGTCASARHAYTPGVLRYQTDTTTGVKLIGYTGNGVVNLFVTISTEFKEEFLNKLKLKWAV